MPDVVDSPGRLDFLSRVLRGAPRKEDLTGPIRGELLGSDQLAEKARALARQQRIFLGKRRRREAPLLARLSTTRRILQNAHARLTEGAGRDVDVGPAGEWLLDNFHVVQEHIREVRQTLPADYYRELPELAGGPLAGFPRVYELAITLISHSEGRVDVENLELFVGAYQTVSPLSIGELWALPAMFRLALIESVRRLSLRTVNRMDEMEMADDWAARIESGGDPSAVAHNPSLAAFIDAPPPLTATFVSRFLHQLRLTRGTHSQVAGIERWIRDRAVGGEDANSQSTQHVALTQVMMAHSIMSLRTIAHLDWKSFVEGQSAMEAVLRCDPSGFYPRMTFATRDRYRHVVEHIAKRTKKGEEAVAEHAIGLAHRVAVEHPESTLRTHVGYYLVDDGLAALEAGMGYRAKGLERIHRFVLRHPNVVFCGGILIATVVAVAAVLLLGGAAARSVWLTVVLLALLPAGDIAISVVNQLVTAYLPATTLPKLDLHGAGGIPAEFRTAVVIPTLFDSVDAVREALENLEVQFLANREAHLHFAILSDFTDAAAATQDGDDEIVETAVEGVRALNARYAGELGDAFYLFHRARRWNPHQGVWMGWERKRGKLAQFNAFVRGGGGDAFSVIVGDVDPLLSVRYVITLDADTVLPPDAAPELVGALAHPLNRAVYDADSGRVVRGYGILQPRVGVSLPSAHHSRFAAIYSGHPGVDPYTTAVSDVYQDLYGEGSFTGKGIYDVEAFELATHGRFPENTLLSHDLVEGSYARAGLATEISVYDDYPTRYLAYTRRKHRWIRGDWQLLDWLRSRVAGPDGPEPNRLTILSRWKILDNLRRSTVEIAQLVFLVAGWLILPGSPLTWTLLGLAAIAAPWIVALLLALLRPPLDRSWRAYYAAVGMDAATSARQVGLAITFLPHQAWISADAIVRTLWRLFVSRRNLLEWQTSSLADRTVSSSAAGVWRAMSPAVAIAGAVLGMAVIALVNGTLAASWTLALVMGPVVALWAVAPAIAHAISRPTVPGHRPLGRADRKEAMRLALLHWRYFDRFVSEDTHWLVPDNYQEDPTPTVAMRTSPTNIGLQLLAIGTARDLGFITTDEMARRLELAFRSLERMRRFRGHFFNWYDLDRDLHVLEPAYVSTVDSGNLAGHLLAIRQACRPGRYDDAPASLGQALSTSLGLATERLGELLESNDPEYATTDASIVTAGELVKLARAEVADASDSTLAPGELGSIAAILLEARTQLRLARAGSSLLGPAEEWIEWSLDRIEQQAESEATKRGELDRRLEALAERAHLFVTEMDFGLLYDPDRELFSIGYNPGVRSLDQSYYDLLASESRLASFVAIAKNDVPLDHWFRLGRSLTRASGETALVSWSGSMFEYLMPLLVMRSFPGTVLDQTYSGAVRRQIAYGAGLGVPWGVSESAYNLRDRHLTYQYRAFGVPDLALKRGLGADLVVAPYASALAIMVDPHRALANLATLERKGTLGPYGFRDAVDYTRPIPGKRFAVVGNYMAHHVGMALSAIANALLDQVWQERFHADPLVRSAELLLHERIPRRLVLQESQETQRDEALPDPDVESPSVREFSEPNTLRPHIALLGRLPYTVMVSHAGSGYSRYEELAVTRWRADGTTDSTGQFCYVKDVTRGRVWSVAHQPTCAPADSYHALLATDRVTFHRSDGVIETRTEIAVVPEDSAEVRLVTLTNRGLEAREVELTSYGEIVLGPVDADRAHPAFANLFVETEWHEWCTAITATRRPRSGTEPSLWCVHVVDRGKDRVGATSCETDRSRFLGRGATPRGPVALTADGPLSGTTGAVLDPIFSLRTRVRLEPGQSASVAFTTLVATSRERAFELADRYHESHTAQRALDLAWTSQQVELRELDLSSADAALFQELAGRLIYPRAEPTELRYESLPAGDHQSLLWANGISGDWPVVLARIESEDGLPTLRQLLTAHHYWRRRGLMVDLVILNTHPFSYLQELHERVVEAMVAANDTETDRPGGVFVRRIDLLPADALRVLEATARITVQCDGRSLAHIADTSASLPIDADRRALESQPRALEQHGHPQTSIAARRIRSHRHSPNLQEQGAYSDPDRRGASEKVVHPAQTDHIQPLFDNGFGGLTESGDYEIRVRGDFVPPAPWANVIANPHGGFVVSERGAGFSWAENSYFYRLTEWRNDPVSDPPTEMMYLRDTETDELWCATPAPILQDAAYTVRHGPGNSVFEFEHAGIATRLTLAMAANDPVKLSSLLVTNQSGRPRRIEVTSYVEWVLGTHREHTQHRVETTFDEDLGVIFARNSYDPYFSRWTAFSALSEPVSAHTADRLEFLGRNGSTDDPVALRLGSLAGRTGTGFDPCAALRCTLELEAGETREIAMILGAVEGSAEARAMVTKYRHPEEASGAVAESIQAWEDRLSVIRVRTPEPSFDAMLNRWTLYQALSCRVWARSALYQSGGAYGFRDQLQDVLSLVYAEPGLAREHIVRAAARQFVEGDVQHWWHPTSGRGVRTRFSDDLAWLPFVVDRYVTVTGDRSVLDEEVPFLRMRPLLPHEHEVYELPEVTTERASVYEHCLRALRKASTVGPHGLPLIGTGDWNDGMNRVGAEGQGESVWLTWFLIATLRGFALRAEQRRDAAATSELRKHADAYVTAVEKHGWDGEWYRRAYFDDGTPLGSHTSDECRIDSIAQSWSVISGAGAPDRQALAMASLEKHLVDPEERLMLLLTPPFDRTTHDPGYIKGYLPGVRENGAQYTHAALWAVLATALRGDGDRAFELFQMLNPLTHTRNRAEVETYRVEPYVVAADVYTAPGQVGRGGWTWYTGAASWMYRVGLESILGFTKIGDSLIIEPRVPKEWPEFSIEYRYGSTTFDITVHQPGEMVSGGIELTLDGRILEGKAIPLVDDGIRHSVDCRPRITDLVTA